MFCCCGRTCGRSIEPSVRSSLDRCFAQRPGARRWNVRASRYHPMSIATMAKARRRFSVEFENAHLELMWPDPTVAVEPGFERAAEKFHQRMLWRSSGWCPIGVGFRETSSAAPHSLSPPGRHIRNGCRLRHRDPHCSRRYPQPIVIRHASSPRRSGETSETCSALSSSARHPPDHRDSAFFSPRLISQFRHSAIYRNRTFLTPNKGGGGSN